MDGCGFKDSSAETLKCFLIRLEGIFLTRNSLHVFVITYLQALYLGPFQLIFQGFESCFQGGWLCRHLLFLEYFEGYEKKNESNVLFLQGGDGGGGGEGGACWVGTIQGCQFSWTIWDTPDSWTVSPGLQIRVWNLTRLIAEVCHWLSNNKISNILNCFSYLTVGIKRFLINSGMLLLYRQ